MATVKFSDFVDAHHFTNGGAPYENRAFCPTTTTG